MKYEKCNVEYTVLGEDKYQVKLSSVYDTNCSEQEYQVVNRKVLEALLESEHEMIASSRRHRVHSCCSYDERFGRGDDPNYLVVEERYFFIIEEEEEKLRKMRASLQPVFNKLTNLQRDRLYIYMADKKIFQEIADAEGVTFGAVRSSCARAIDRLKQYGNLFQNIDKEGWIDLLKSPNFEKYFKFFS
jgi:hypothetical protein